MGQACNQRIFRTTFTALIDPSRTGFTAPETAIIQPGLQSMASGQDYLQLTMGLAGAPPAGASRPTVLVRYTLMAHRGGDSYSVSRGWVEAS